MSGADIRAANRAYHDAATCTLNALGSKKVEQRTNAHRQLDELLNDLAHFTPDLRASRGEPEPLCQSGASLEPTNRFSKHRDVLEPINLVHEGLELALQFPSVMSAARDGPAVAIQRNEVLRDQLAESFTELVCAAGAFYLYRLSQNCVFVEHQFPFARPAPPRSESN
jgi:hypothetical protein